MLSLDELRTAILGIAKFAMQTRVRRTLLWTFGIGKYYTWKSSILKLWILKFRLLGPIIMIT